MKTVDIYTDGACRGNPGPGGWGVLLVSGDREKELFGGELDTTNNRMELLAVIEALSAIKGACRISLYTDSQYVLKGITEWLATWKKNNWKTAAKTPVKNIDLWQALDKAVSQHHITWHWVKGHAGHPGNERADALAQLGVAQIMSN